MGALTLCEVCGNEVDAALISCPYCGSKKTPQYVPEKTELFRVIDLEKGMPLVHEALERLEREMQSAHADGVKLLVLIHGYGSSGEGGAIKEAVRQTLQSCLQSNKLSELLPGEECGKRTGRVKNLVRRFPSAKEYLQRANPGITLVIPG